MLLLVLEDYDDIGCYVVLMILDNIENVNSKYSLTPF